MATSRRARSVVARGRAIQDLEHRLRRTAEGGLRAVGDDRALDQDRVLGHEPEPLGAGTVVGRREAQGLGDRLLRPEDLLGGLLQLLAQGVELVGRRGRVEVADDLDVEPALLEERQGLAALAAAGVVVDPQVGHGGSLRRRRSYA